MASRPPPDGFSRAAPAIRPPEGSAQQASSAVNEERLKTIILDEAYRTIKVSEGKRQITIPMAQAVIRAVAVNAARGQHRSQQLFAELVSETERANKALSRRMAADGDRVQAELGARTRASRQARPCRPRASSPSRQPRHRHEDRPGHRQGPFTKEEKVEWDRLRAQVEDCDREIEGPTASLKERKNKRFRSFVEDDIAHERRIRDIIVKAIGEPRDRSRR